MKKYVKKYICLCMISRSPCREFPLLTNKKLQFNLLNYYISSLCVTQILNALHIYIFMAPYCFKADEFILHCVFSFKKNKYGGSKYGNR